MRRVVSLLLVTIAVSQPLSAQRLQHTGIVPRHVASETSSFYSGLMDSESRPMPAWEKAAIIGAVTGGLGFAVLHETFSGWNTNQNSLTHDVLVGTIGGAAVFGGAIAFYDWVCAPGSASDNAGMCTRGRRNLRLRDDAGVEKMTRH